MRIDIRFNDKGDATREATAGNIDIYFDTAEDLVKAKRSIDALIEMLTEPPSRPGGFIGLKP